MTEVLLSRPSVFGGRPECDRPRRWLPLPFPFSWLTFGILYISICSSTLEENMDRHHLPGIYFGTQGSHLLSSVTQKHAPQTCLLGFRRLTFCRVAAEKTPRQAVEVEVPALMGTRGRRLDPERVVATALRWRLPSATTTIRVL